MQVDREYLVSLREKAEAQRLRLLSDIHQAIGAIAIVDALIQRLDTDEPKSEEGGAVSPSTPKERK